MVRPVAFNTNVHAFLALAIVDLILVARLHVEGPADRLAISIFLRIRFQLLWAQNLRFLLTLLLSWAVAEY